jgi:hypothetical protein
MYTQCKARKRITSSGLRRMISDVEEVVKDTEEVEEVKEDLAEVGGR